MLPSGFRCRIGVQRFSRTITSWPSDAAQFQIILRVHRAGALGGLAPLGRIAADAQRIARLAAQQPLDMLVLNQDLEVRHAVGRLAPHGGDQTLFVRRVLRKGESGSWSFLERRPSAIRYGVLTACSVTGPSRPEGSSAAGLPVACACSHFWQP